MPRKKDLTKFILSRAIPIAFVVISIIVLLPKPLNERIDNSLIKAKVFLVNQNLDKDILGNAYEDCLKDESKCTVPDGTYIYKRIDASLDFVFLKDENFSTSGLERKIDDANSFLRGVLRILPNRSIDYSYIDKSREPGDFALDLYCILGWTYNDTSVYRIIRNELKPYGWTNPNETQFWRKVIDETWCISLLAENHEDEKVLKQQVDLKSKEFISYINSSDYLDRKIIAGNHILLMFDRLESYGYDISEYFDLIQFTKSYIVDQIKNGKLRYPLDVYHNSLYSLAKSGYEDKTFLQDLAGKILAVQNADGSWNIGSDGRYRILTTLRASIAINLFKVNYMNP
ncbi:MAG: hypothetical protein J4452_01280 [Candidatus Aenigmarchaeota archaeon]|nr:hypothetical protein [Candidatus Aenigmarchaeota archaeon]